MVMTHENVYNPSIAIFHFIYLIFLNVLNLILTPIVLPFALQYLVRTEHYLADIPAFGMLSDLELNSVTREILLGLLLKSPSLVTLVFQVCD